MTIPDKELPNKIKLKQEFRFKANPILTDYIRKNIINVNEFTNRALNFFMQFTQNPEFVMKELKFRYPEQWKRINQLKFDNRDNRC